MECPDEFLASHEPVEGLEYVESTPINRRRLTSLGRADQSSPGMRYLDHATCVWSSTSSCSEFPRRLECRQSGLIYSTPPAPAAYQQAGISSAAMAAGQLPLQLLLQRFKDVVNPSKVLPQTSHGVGHHLETRGPPNASPFRRLDTEKLAAAKAEFAALERDGIIRWSSSPWASPLHMVKKPDGSWRCCGDYRRLPNVTVPDTYPLPNMMDFSSRTPFGLFEFLRLTFGLRNAGSTFHWPMDRVLGELVYAFVYFDDIIIASSSMEQHQWDVEEVFRLLQAAGLVINFEKCTFAIPEVDFLGHRVSASGFAPLPSRVAAIQKYLRPETVKQLLAFLGVFYFYRRFVPAAAKILRPLTDLTRGSP
jgi:hypothetical protein